MKGVTKLLNGHAVAPLMLDALKELLRYSDVTSVHWAQTLDSGAGDSWGLITEDGHVKASFNALWLFEKVLPAAANQSRAAMVRQPRASGTSRPRMARTRCCLCGGRSIVRVKRRLTPCNWTCPWLWEAYSTERTRRGHLLRSLRCRRATWTIDPASGCGQRRWEACGVRGWSGKALCALVACWHSRSRLCRWASRVGCADCSHAGR